MNAILYDAAVYPQYRVNKRPTIVVISGVRIADIGHDLKTIRNKYPSHRMIDLEGRAVIPGLVDAHTHFYFWAVAQDSVHVDGIEEFDDALNKIKKFSKNKDANEWIVGDGWCADRWKEYHLPTAEELDSVTGGRPGALFSKDQHMMWVNSRALQLAGIDEKTPEPDGGKIDRIPGTTRPSGVLREVPGYFPVFRLICKSDPRHVERSFKKASRIAYSKGITGFHSLDGPEAWEFFEKLHGQKKLGFRVHYYFPVDRLDDLIKKKMVTGMGDETLRIGGIKIFSDGALGSQTAFMKKPYLGSNGNQGLEVTGFGKLKEIIAKASRNNLACAIHAIGDGAVANVISAFKASDGKSSLRHRIEHLQIISRSDIRRLKETGVIASMQPIHCPSDRQLVASYWGERGRNTYIFKTLLKNNIPLAFGSDCPIEPIDPIAGIHAAVNRTGSGERGGKFYPKECLTVAQAVYGFTAGAAYAAGRESFSGKIVPGYQADLVILDDNIYTMPPSQIYKAKIALTIFDGRVVFKSGPISL
jgi:predicted amidohydrolase YtcJ